MVELSAGARRHQCGRRRDPPAALYTPVWTSAITAPVDVGIAAVALAMLLTGRVPPLVVVAFCAVAGQLVSA